MALKTPTLPVEVANVLLDERKGLRMHVPRRAHLACELRHDILVYDAVRGREEGHGVRHEVSLGTSRTASALPVQCEVALEWSTKKFRVSCASHTWNHHHGGIDGMHVETPAWPDTTSCQKKTGQHGNESLARPSPNSRLDPHRAKAQTRAPKPEKSRA